MRWPRGQSAHLRGTPAHPRLQRAELSEAAGGVVRQVAGGLMEEGGSLQGGVPATQAGRQPGGLPPEVRRDQDVGLGDTG